MVVHRERVNEMLKLSEDNDYRSVEQISARSKYSTGIHIVDEEGMLEPQQLEVMLNAFEKDNK